MSISGEADLRMPLPLLSEGGGCDSIYFLCPGEVFLGAWTRALLYSLALAYCFLGLSSITARFFRSMENVVKHSRDVVTVDPVTGEEVVRRDKVWNYTIADITLLAFGTSFPQISLSTIDAIRNIGQLYSGGLGPGTLVGSAAFDLFPIHAVCVVVPKAGSLKRISDLGVWLVELFWSFWAYVWLYIILKEIMECHVAQRGVQCQDLAWHTRDCESDSPPKSDLKPDVFRRVYIINTQEGISLTIRAAMSWNFAADICLEFVQLG